MIPGARLVVLGKQGAGKGTQSARLARHLVVPHISTGDLFRQAVRDATSLGRLAKKYMDAGELVPDEVVVGMVEERLRRPDATKRGFVLDGFPRTVEQAEALFSLLGPDAIHIAVDLEVSTEVVLARLAARRVCPDCGSMYQADPPDLPTWPCTRCGGTAVQRDDDTELAIRRRLELYDQATAPLLSWFAARGRLVSVDGHGPPDEVAARVAEAVDGRLAALRVSA